MDNLLAARTQMGTSLAFHIIFAAIGIGLPLLLIISEGLYLKTKDLVYLALARKWAKATAILFAIGAVSGTVLSFELGLLWPRFMQFAGGIIGMPFSMEGFAFFTEAIFLGLYLYGHRILSPLAHWLTTIPLAISGLASGIFIVSANGWMNSPSGFTYINGQVSNVNPVAALLNKAWAYEAVHSSSSMYLTVGFAVAAIYAFGILRGKNDKYHRTGLMLGLIMAFCFIPVQIISGDASAKWVAANQPTKLAAMESLFQTKTCAPLTIGGFSNTQQDTNQLAIEIPCGLSFLISENPNTKVTGLDDFPAENRPNPAIVHPAFDIMVSIAGIMTFVALWTGFEWIRTRRIPQNRFLLLALSATGILGFIGIEAGWTVTEVGRQPWVIFGVLRTSQAVTTAPGVFPLFIFFTLLYIALSVILVWLLLRLAKEPDRVLQKLNEISSASEEQEYGVV